MLLLIVDYGFHDQPPSTQVVGSGDLWLLKGSDVVNMINFAFVLGSSPICSWQAKL
jgi:hypothetical protein